MSTSDAVNSNDSDPKAVESIPRHLAIIMDGNGRWAKKRNLPRIAGHRKGVEVVREVVNSCTAKGISYLTLFAFSSENWRRPGREVKLLMELFLATLEREINKLHKNNIRFRVIGEISGFDEKIVKKIHAAEELTKNNSSLTLNIAANYGGRWDITQACAKVAQRVEAGELDPKTITEDTVAEHLSISGVPDPDLFIRTGGDKRISNFLLWQLAYTELYFTDVLWPDFNNDEFENALTSYAQRQRRFGLTGEQIEAAQHA